MAEIPHLKSRSSVHKSFVRFHNKTERKVDVIWINYEGHHIKYKTLLPGSFYDVNTFVTHPWLFIDSETQDRLVVKSKEVFCPEPFRHFRREEVPPRLERTHIHITIPVYSLRQRCLQVLRNNLSQPEDALKLELPVSLQKELADMVRESTRTRVISNH
ncbi:hypothetical protein L9F63_010197 [Diploptera punctata]|uniref:von Hippel-Lindau disease tumor suppressor n=1 Tax=Diploptera punctata TaxID=6984 RepID=A0AAD8AHS4_DIPPU|nr:hypothetical protein L9F63_010197 [Diploptera punctata]